MDEDKLYNIAYQHLRQRILTSFYVRGSSLPTVPMLCTEFRVSTFTIHRAFEMLEKERLVSISQGRSAIVTYDASPEECAARFLSNLYASREAVIDLQALLSVIWPDILLQGLWLCGERDLDALDEIARGFTLQNSKVLHSFFDRIIGALGNALIFNFHTSVNLFLNAANCANRRIFASFFSFVQDTAGELLRLRRAGDFAGSRDALVAFIAEHGRVIRSFYETLPPDAGERESVAYHWNCFMGRPQISFMTAMELLRQIYSSYGKGAFLPSVRRLSEQLAVPVMSVRRAIGILNEVGITESINGKGTRVIVGDGVTVEISRLSSPNLKKALIPYLESIQFILITCKNTVLSAFPHLHENAVRQAVERLRAIVASGNYYRTFGACLDLLTAGARSPAVREVYSHLKYLQYLGYPLNDMKPNDFRFDERSTRALLNALERRDAALFAAEMERLTLDIFVAGKQKLLAGGVREVESLAMPRLLEPTASR